MKTEKALGVRERGRECTSNLRESWVRKRKTQRKQRRRMKTEKA
jgi:hypothetical protein